VQTIDLSGKWRLVRITTREEYPALVPGDTHSALIAAGAIPDPYPGMNELDVQWVGREDWAYERDFTIGKDLLAEDRVLLSCDSLDTLAEVFLNGRRIGASDNMFVRWMFDAKPFLKQGKNALRVVFHSAEKAAVAAAARLPYPLPYSSYPVQSPHRNLVRKAQCHGGWDWGPCLMVAGIYGGISLLAFSDARIDYVYTEQRHGRGKCVVRVFVECEASRDGGQELEVSLGAPAVAAAASPARSARFSASSTTVTRTVHLAKGANRVHVDLTVDSPQLWWPNGYGAQPLYTLSVRLGGHAVTKTIGLRTLELVNREDRKGLSMVVRVNGTDVFCKGANWIPFDALPQRQTRGRLEQLLESAVWANMNMIRVWGGGQYESDDFYTFCDQKGLLIWHDMMFACALYPAVPSFLSNVEREIRHQVKRLRDHPSIALWCGNNENVGALVEHPESKKNRDRYIVDYDRLNEGTVGRVVDECDPTRVFWPSSPSAGRGDYSDNWHDDSRGDMHYWSVWHEGKSFSAYYDVVPRFCSEFGYQSFPSLRTIRSYAREEDMNVTAPVMEHHQRNPGGNSRITEMFTRYYRVPEGFASFVYLSQVQQAVAIKTAVEYWRSLRPTCMGAIYWQLNDIWPVCSWSSLEYDGTWKLLHYAARRFYAPVLLCAYLRDGRVEVWAMNDLPEAAKASAAITFMDFSGVEVKGEKRELRLQPGSSQCVRSYALADLGVKPTEAFLHLALTRGGETSCNELFLSEPKRCPLPRARITASVAASGSGFTVRLSSNAPAFSVGLFSDNAAGEFDDNCFTLLPDAARAVRFLPREKTSLERFRRGLSIHQLGDSYR
jgi:beta-mannosidase